MKKIIVALVVLVLALAFGIFYFSNKISAPVAQTDVLGSFANWKTYDGKASFGLTLKYPADWTVTFDENFKDYIDFSPAEGNGFAVLIIKDADKKQTLAQWLKARDKEASEVMGGQYKDKVISSKNVKVGKLSAVQRVEYLDAAGFTLIHTYLKKGGDVYMFTLRIMESGIYTAEEAKIYKKILSTVKFVK